MSKVTKCDNCNDMKFDTLDISKKRYANWFCRPKVGDKVRVVVEGDNRRELGEEGILIEDDGSETPFRVRFDTLDAFGGYYKKWFDEDEIEVVKEDEIEVVSTRMKLRWLKRMKLRRRHR